MEVQARMFPDYTPEKRQKAMTKLALRVEEMDYSKPLTESELIIENQQNSQDTLTISNLEAQKKESNAKFTAQIKAVKAIQTQRIQVIMTERREVNGKLWLFADQQGGKVNYYDKDGVCIKSRPLAENEKNNQLFIGDNTDQITNGMPNGHDIEDVDFVEENGDLTPPVEEEMPVILEEKPKAGGKRKKGLSKKVEAAMANALLPNNDEVKADEDARREPANVSERALSATEKKIKQMTGNRKKVKEKVLKAEAEQENAISLDVTQPIEDLPELGEDLDHTSDLPDPNA